MKIQPRQVEGFLRAPPPDCVAVLIYGPDRGLAAQRARALIERTLVDPNDPFSLAELDAEEVKKRPSLLLDEALAIGFAPGRRVVRLRDAQDGAAKAVGAALDVEALDALIVIEAGELSAGSSLRKLIERSPRAAALPCYRREGGELKSDLRSRLAETGLRLSPEAEAHLLDRSGADSEVLAREVEKLLCFKGERTEPLELADIEPLIDDGAAIGVEDAVRAAFAFEPAAAHRALDKAFGLGEAPVRVLRAAQSHLMRMIEAAAAIENGAPARAALDALRPPVHFRAKPALLRALEQWRPAELRWARGILQNAELDAKSTGKPEQLIARQAFFRIAASRWERSSHPR